MAKKLSPMKAAQRILSLGKDGRDRSWIEQNHPELSDGWAHIDRLTPGNADPSSVPAAAGSSPRGSGPSRESEIDFSV